MQIFTDTKFEFMGKRYLGLGFSALLLAAALGGIFVKGFNFGIDFEGGTEVEFKFAEEPDVGTLRAQLSSLPVEPSIQRIGRPGENTILVRARSLDGESDVSHAIVAALYSSEETASLAAGRADLNRVGNGELSTILSSCQTPPADAAALATQVLKLRTSQQGLLGSYDSVGGVDGMTPDLVSCLRSETFLPRFAKWKSYFVGPKVGQELRTKAYWAIGFALAGIMAYIWYRFQVEYGIAAVLALFHDVVITTGLIVLIGGEFTLTVVAALLTLAGYSVNDTIVVFDRIRENLRLMKNKDLPTVINHSINQTLSRTVLTAVTTLVVVGTMFFFGGPEFRGFSLALLIGVTLGTYSSIFVASPLVVLWHEYFTQARSRRVARA